MAKNKNIGVYSTNSIALKASLIEGVGVFATHSLNSGIELFTNWRESSRIYSQDELDSLGELRKYLCSYQDGYIGPDSFDNMHLSWFMNHSDNPNVGVIGDVTGKYISLREIQEGEELLIDYNIIGATII